MENEIYLLTLYEWSKLTICGARMLCCFLWVMSGWFYLWSGRQRRSPGLWDNRGRMETSWCGELGWGMRQTQQAWGLYTRHPLNKLDGEGSGTGSLHLSHPCKRRLDGAQLSPTLIFLIFPLSFAGGRGGITHSRKLSNKSFVEKNILQMLLILCTRLL